MQSVKQTNLYQDILTELNYSFADVFIFDGYVVAEIKRGVNVSWEQHAKIIVEDVSCYLGTDGSDIIYISNRINPYAVMAADWLKFFKNNYKLKGYYIVSQTQGGKINLMVEKLFFKKKIRNFTSIFDAINWAKKGLVEVE